MKTTYHALGSSLAPEFTHKFHHISEKLFATRLSI